MAELFLNPDSHNPPPPLRDADSLCEVLSIYLE